MTTALLATAVFISSVIGYLIVSLITYHVWGQREFFLMRITLGIGIGYGVTSILSFIWQAAMGAVGAPYLVFELFLTAGLYWALRKIMKQGGDLQFPVSPGTRKKSPWVLLLQASLWGTILLGVIIFVFGTLIAPSGMWDAWMVQNRTARFFYLGGEYWTSAFSPLLVSADYPPLVGMSIARLWRYAGHETIFGPVFFAFTITAALAGFLISAIIYLRGHAFAYIAGLILFTSSAFLVFAPAQLADIPVAFYFLATIVLLRIYENNATPQWALLILAGTTAALALWTKNEGWLFLIAVFISHFIVVLILKKKPVQMRPLMYFILGLLPVILTVLFFKFVFAPAHDFVRHQPDGFSLADQLLNPSRYLLIAQSYLIQLYDLTPDRSTPLIALFLVVLFFGINPKRLNSTSFISGFLVLLIMLGGEFVIYLITPNDLQWQVSSSIHRLFLQIWPIFVFETMMSINMPQLDRND
jgi:hypothetical protein